MGTFLASNKVSGCFEPSNSSPTRPIPPSIRPLMSAFECSQVAWCVLQPPPRVRPLALRSGPSVERVARQRRGVRRRRGGLERVYAAHSGAPRSWAVEGRSGVHRAARNRLRVGRAGSDGGPGW